MDGNGEGIKGSIPQVEQLKEIVLEVLQSGRPRTFESLEREVALRLGLTSRQRNYCVGKSKTTLYANRLEKARAELHREKVIEYPSPKKVKLAKSEKSEKDSPSQVPAKEGEGVAQLKPKRAAHAGLENESPDGLTDVVGNDPAMEYGKSTSHKPKTLDSKRLSTSKPPNPGAHQKASVSKAVEKGEAAAGSSHARTLSSFAPVALAALGLLLCLTGSLAFGGAVCGGAALALSYWGRKVSKPLSSPKATLALGALSLVLGLVIGIGGMAGPVDDGQNAVQEPSVSSGENAAAATAEEHGSLSFVVDLAANSSSASTMKVSISGQQNDGVRVRDSIEAVAGVSYALPYPAGSYTFTVDPSLLNTGEVIYKAESPSCTFDGKRDRTVHIGISQDTAAMQKAQKAKEEAAAAEAAAVAAAEAEAQVAAAVDSDDGGDRTVYITKTGEKYHAGGCRYLKKSQIPISIDDAIARGYDPCSVCNP